jgi:hypothetical protein
MTTTQIKGGERMSVGIIDLWVPDAFKNKCSIDNTNTFVATVQHCDGTILEWKGGRYQTKDGAWHQILGDPNGIKPGTPGVYDGVPGTGDPGHVTFEVPPGCYMVTASLHVWTGFSPGKEALLGNLTTHKAMVNVSCGEHACVTVYQPTGIHCGEIMFFQLLLPVMEANNLIKPEERQNAEKALRPIFDKLVPSPLDKAEAEIVKMTVKRLSARR